MPKYFIPSQTDLTLPKKAQHLTHRKKEGKTTHTPRPPEQMLSCHTPHNSQILQRIPIRAHSTNITRRSPPLPPKAPAGRCRVEAPKNLSLHSIGLGLRAPRLEIFVVRDFVCVEGEMGRGALLTLIGGVVARGVAFAVDHEEGLFGRVGAPDRQNETSTGGLMTHCTARVREGGGLFLSLPPFIAIKRTFFSLPLHSTNQRDLAHPHELHATTARTGAVGLGVSGWRGLCVREGQESAPSPSSLRARGDRLALVDVRFITPSTFGKESSHRRSPGRWIPHPPREPPPPAERKNSFFGFWGSVLGNWHPSAHTHAHTRPPVLSMKNTRASVVRDLKRPPPQPRKMPHNRSSISLGLSPRPLEAFVPTHSGGLCLRRQTRERHPCWATLTVSS